MAAIVCWVFLPHLSLLDTYSQREVGYNVATWSVVHRPVNSQHVTGNMLEMQASTRCSASGLTVKKIPKWFVQNIKYEKHNSVWQLSSKLSPHCKHFGGSPLPTGWCLRSSAGRTNVSVARLGNVYLKSLTSHHYPYSLSTPSDIPKYHAGLLSTFWIFPRHMCLGFCFPFL